MASTTHSRLFCCRCCHCCCCSYVASPVHMFFATTIFRYLSTTIHDEASRCVASSVSSGSKTELNRNTCFRIEVLYTNTNGVNFHHPRWHPCPLPRLENILKKEKLSWTQHACWVSCIDCLIFMALPHIAGISTCQTLPENKAIWALQELSWMQQTTVVLTLWPQHIPRICSVKL